MTRDCEAVGRLLVCPTPIGNLADVTLRVLQALGEADVIACEDTRRTRILLQRHRLLEHPAPRLVSYHEHNEPERARELLGTIRRGATVALVSDAGMPAISDPGSVLMRACIDAGLRLEVLPGPSAVIVALLQSGLPAERFTFAGFLERSRAARAQLLARNGETLVVFESPNRIASTLEQLAALDPGRPVAVCRELTKLHEEVLRGTACALAEHFAEHRARGEIVLVVGAAAPPAADREQAAGALRSLVAAGAKPRPAAGAIAKLTGLGANELYRELTRPQ
jgi:16S rRNA (cytidine1402-2'-O)-methyltransferase